MGLKLKNTSSVKETFGLMSGFGVFANNKAIRNNPELISILASRKSRSDAKKRQFSSVTVHKVNHQKQAFERTKGVTNRPSLTKSWGGVCNHLGNLKTLIFDSLREALLEVDKIAKRRQYKNYKEMVS